MPRRAPLALVIGIAATLIDPAGAAAAVGGGHFDGAELGFVWVVPFIGILLSIAILPLATPTFWHHHFGKVSAFWALAFLVPFAIRFGPGETTYQFLHTALLEYIPFIILLFALFTVAGGVRLKGSLRGTPAVNTLMLAIGTVIASWTGTTGAAMLLIRPVLRANEWRKHQVHVVVFFIFLVANIGGSLTPLGDPPLFLGFLKGVSFFWTMNLLPPLLLVGGILLVVFFALDTYLYRREPPHDPDAEEAKEKLGLDGKINILFLAGIVGAVLLSGVWKSGVAFPIYGVDVDLQNLVRDILLLAIAYFSMRFTATETRAGNGFSWGPIAEVAKLFAGIFLTIIPAIAILRAGRDGALAPLVALAHRPDGSVIDAAYFWLSGGLSSFLDNAPTYLIFFNMAGGDPEALMGPMARTLLAVSVGSVFMGANTYIGNAPNFMVRAIAEERGVKMPSFFGYMLWSGAILIPCFLLTTWVFFI